MKSIILIRGDENVLLWNVSLFAIQRLLLHLNFYEFGTVWRHNLLLHI